MDPDIREEEVKELLANSRYSDNVIAIRDSLRNLDSQLNSFQCFQKIEHTGVQVESDN